jgi:hypothetical protein
VLRYPGGDGHRWIVKLMNDALARIMIHLFGGGWMSGAP